MINRRIKIRLLSILLLSACSVHTYSQSGNMDKLDKKVQRIEHKADRKFIKQDFYKAMKIYESALKKTMSDECAAKLHMKTARLYMTLLEHKQAIPHYEKAMHLREDQFTSVDICNYLDALRFSGERIKAIVVARKYAFRDVYKSDQRYLNILHALNYEGGLLPVGVSEYIVSRLDHVTTPYSEYWVGKMNNEYFYATSNSNFHDPNKKFYHRTKYYSLDKESEFAFNAVSRKKGSRELLHMVPVDLQNGPLSFATDMSKMIVTAVSYDKGEGIRMTSNGLIAFKTKLYLSKYDSNRKGWSSFILAFPQKEEYSYAHPFLFNNDRSLLFASDMDTGYGGYDLYVSHWDDNLQTWGEPINLGPKVNTEGDEIFPALYDDTLIFSSNGHVGFGGYDIYNILYEDGHLVDGSLNHFDYPINTVDNDFSMVRIDNNRGYIVSDRSHETKDDIFYFERNKLYKENDLIYGLSETDAISNGTISLVNDLGDNNRLLHEKLPSFSLTYQSALNIYFDFDKFGLNNNAIDDLSDWLYMTDFTEIASILIDGYADEIGTEDYNFQLSQRRAQTVANWLQSQDIDIPVEVRGRGQIIIEEGDTDLPFSMLNYREHPQSKNSTISVWDQRVWLRREARRVEIKVTLKK
jgi:outer membrane protein OmpA-like peptidoglycan-associated protein